MSRDTIERWTNTSGQLVRQFTGNWSIWSCIGVPNKCFKKYLSFVLFASNAPCKIFLSSKLNSGAFKSFKMKMNKSRRNLIYSLNLGYSSHATTWCRYKSERARRCCWSSTIGSFGLLIWAAYNHLPICLASWSTLLLLLPPPLDGASARCCGLTWTP